MPLLPIIWSKILLTILEPKNIEFYIDTDETEYFPLPVELRTNIKNLSNFISSMFPENTIKSKMVSRMIKVGQLLKL